MKPLGPVFSTLLSPCIPGVSHEEDFHKILDLFDESVVGVSNLNKWGFPKMVVPNNHGFSY